MRHTVANGFQRFSGFLKFLFRLFPPPIRRAAGGGRGPVDSGAGVVGTFAVGAFFASPKFFKTVGVVRGQVHNKR